MEKSKTSYKTGWDRENTLKVSLKLNHRTDKDIIDALPEQGKQTQIKAWIRQALKSKEGE